jgi:hypothetical protein
MTYKAETPFDSVDAAHQYVTLLIQALNEARTGVDEDVALAKGEGATRRLETLQLVTYKLDRLKQHLGASRRLLNDLRTLRRLLLCERPGPFLPGGTEE